MSLLCLHCGRFGHVKEACEEFLKLLKGRERCGGNAEEESSVEYTMEEGGEQRKESP